VSRQLIDASQAGDYTALMTQNHVDYYGYGDPQSGQKERWTMPQLACRFGTPIMVSFVETRHDANYSNVAWTHGRLTHVQT